MKKLLINRFISLRQPFFDRKVWATIFIGVSLLVSLWIVFVPNIKNAKKCFQRSAKQDDDSTISYLIDLMESKKMPQKGKTIFFHETSCSKDGLVRLNAR